MRGRGPLRRVGLAVLERQLGARPAVTDWPVIDAAAPLDAQCAAVRGL